MPQIVLPDAPELKAIFGADGPSLRAYRARLLRAERAGKLPPRRHLSRQRFVYVREELEAKLAALLAPGQGSETEPAKVPPRRRRQGLRRASQATK